MHKYIKKQSIIQRKSLIQNKQKSHILSPVNQLRLICQSGQTLSQQKCIDLIQRQQTNQNKRNFIKQLLMFRKIKLVQKLQKSNKINIKRLIESNDTLKLVYENQLNQINNKNTDNQKQQIKQDLKDLNDELNIKQMTKSQRIIKYLKKYVKLIKNISPKVYFCIIALIFTAFIVKKYRLKIISLLRIIFNL